MSEVFNADVLDAINRALSAENVVTREGEEPVYCNVNNETREIEIPGEITIFGVEHDENAVRVFFKCPKIIGNNVDIDITQSMVYIIYINAGGEKDQYIVTDVNETEDGNVTFSWLINRKPAKYQGITQFGIRVIKSKTGGEIENEWNTTVANANILNGVETEDIELSGDNIDVVNQLLDLTKQEIELTKQNLIEEIEQKGQETLETIPSDYTTAAQNALSAKNEVEDIRVGADGTMYKSAGNAVRNQINNTMKYGNIIGSSSGVEYEGEIKKFGDLDPKKSYLIWRNAYKTFPDIDENVKNLLGTRDTDNLYVSVALWAGQTAKTYDANTYVIPVTITGNGISIACVWRGATTKTLELYTYFTSTDPTLSLEGKAADAKSTGDMFTDLKDRFGNMSLTNLISPDGSKWTIQVSNSGALISIPVIPNNALFIGNSLLLGFGEFGMAASDAEHDYYHYISSLNPEGSYTRLSGSGFEASTSTEIATQWMNDTLLPELNDELDLVIVQLGDNVNTEGKRRTFSETCKMILEFIRTHAPNARVVWVGSWYAKELKTTYEKACKETGCMYVDITDITGSNKIGGIYTVSQSTSTTYSVDSFEVLEDKQIKIYFTVEGNQYNATVHYDSYSSNAGVSVTIVGKEKVITSSGVASHPGNSGMLAIANRIAYSLGMIEEEGDIF